MHPLAERLLAHIRRHEFLKAGDRVGVAVSGGIDSVALLRLLLELRNELGIVISIIHFNHKLRGAESDADHEFVAALARERDLEFYSDSDDVAEYATQQRLSLETAARELRYAYFRHLLGEGESHEPHGLKPTDWSEPSGTAEAVPFAHSQSESPQLERSQSKAIRLDKIATGHTLDDQAETVLMRIIRGTGLRGLAAIHPRLAVEDDSGELSGEIIRPLLSIRRRDLEHYLAELKQTWREDATNAEQKFTRNRIRREILPIIEQQFNPSITENLAELAEIARAEEDYWQNEAAGWQGTAVHWFAPDWLQAARSPKPPDLVQIAPPRASKEPDQEQESLSLRIANAPWLLMNAAISRMWFLAEPLAVQRRVIKSIGDEAKISLEFKHVEEILRFAAQEQVPGKELSLPQGWKVLCEPDSLTFITPDLRQLQPRSADYEYDLAVPGETSVPEAHITIRTRRICPEKERSPYNPDELLDPDLLTGPLLVRNWRPGDRFWPAHTKSAKKVKELLQERHVPQPERRLWPVVISGDEIVWLRGFPVPAKFRAEQKSPAIQITVNEEEEFEAAP